MVGFTPCSVSVRHPCATQHSGGIPPASPQQLWALLIPALSSQPQFPTEQSCLLPATTHHRARQLCRKAVREAGGPSASNCSAQQDTQEPCSPHRGSMHGRFSHAVGCLRDCVHSFLEQRHGLRMTEMETDKVREKDRKEEEREKETKRERKRGEGRRERRKQGC